MNKVSLAAVAIGLLAIAACNRGNEDQLNITDNEVAQDLNALSDEAAGLAAEAEALENQANQLEQEAQSTDGEGAETPADENIVGM